MGWPSLALEPLEERVVLSVSLDTISGPDTNSAFDVPSGKNLYVPLIGTDSNQTATYTASSSNSQVTATVLANLSTLSMTVHGVKTDGTPFSGTMTFALFDDVAPQTVQGIIDKVNQGLYNGASFYRMETASDFQLIQGGIEKTSGRSDTTVLPDEFNVAATFNSSGLLAMASAGPGTATSEFFVTGLNRPLGDDPQTLNFGYTVFGQILTGLDVYQDILGVSTTAQSGINYADTPVTIDSASIFTDHQHAVLRISEPDGFTGSSNITVTATGSDSTTAQQSFAVNVIDPSTNSTEAPPLFLSPVADVTTPSGAPVTITLSATDAHSITPTFSVTGADGFSSTPSNVTVSVVPGANNTATVLLTPAAGFTGTISLLAHADDTTYSTHDAQAFTLTVESGLTISSVTTPINQSNVTQTTISGTGTAGDTITVIASDGTNSTDSKSTTVGDDGNWSISGIDTTNLADGTITYTASSAAGGTEQTTTAKDTQPPAVAITSSPTVNQSTVSGASASGTGEVGATISLVASDGTHTSSAATTTVGSDGNWTISTLDTSGLDDGPLTYTATATDIHGNTAQATATVTKDTVAPAVAITSATNPVDLSNAGSVTASGTGEAGASISLVVSDGTHTTTARTTTVGDDGNWSIATIDLSALNDGAITYTVTATDAAQNTAQSNFVASKATVNVTLVTDPINASNANNVSVSGTGQIGANISVVVSDGTNSTEAVTTTVGEDGAWTINGIDTTSLADGSLTFTVTASDDADHSAQVTRTVTKDVVAPTVTIASVTNPINIANASSVTASGTGEAGTTISLVVTDGTNSTVAKTTTVAANGTWTISGIDTTSLADGSLTFTATDTDAAQNTSQATSTASKDTVAPTVAVTSVTDPVKIASAASASASGTGEVGATISLVVSDSSHSTSAMTTTVGSDGTWSITGINVGSLVDGTITYTATASDAAGNTATGSLSATKTTVAVTLVTNPISNTNAASTSASGTGEAGASISLVASDGDVNTSTYTGTIAADGTWSITGIDTTALADGTITYTVTATDSANNTAVATKTTAKDTAAPAVAITSVTSSIDSTNSTNVSASGTGEVGANISLVASDGTTTTSAYTATVGSDGTWSITGIDTSALADGTITFTATAKDTAGNTAQGTATATKTSTSDGSLSGFVYVDVDNTGTMGDGALVLQGVILTLTGVDGQGHAVPSQSTTTASDGSYSFNNLVPGTYTITETQPEKLNEGMSVVGSLGGTNTASQISSIAVTSGAAGTGYNFSEAGVARSVFSLGLFLGRNNSVQQTFNDLVTTWGTSAPVATSIASAETSGTESTVQYTVKFNTDVTGVDASDFAATGTAGASITDVSGSGSAYTVSMTTSTTGTVGLSLVDDDSIVDAAGHPLGGSGAGNGNFVSSVYTQSASSSAQAQSANANLMMAPDATDSAQTSASDLVDQALADEENWA